MDTKYWLVSWNNVIFVELCVKHMLVGYGSSFISVWVGVLMWKCRLFNSFKPVVPSGCLETVRIRSEWFFRSQRSTTGSIRSSRFTAGMRCVDTRALSQTLVSRGHCSVWIEWKHTSDWFKALFVGSLFYLNIHIYHYWINYNGYFLWFYLSAHCNAFWDCAIC